GEVTSAASPCPTSKNRTTSADGGPTPSADDQMISGKIATTSTITGRGGRHLRCTPQASANTNAAPTMSTSGPPPDVTWPTGAFASRSPTHSRYSIGINAIAELRWPPG